MTASNNPENNMRNRRKLAAACLAVSVLALTPAAAQEQRAAPALGFHVVDNFLKLPEHMNMAEVVGTALDSKGHVFVLNRGHQPILEFNADGSFMRTIGEGIPTEGPHNVRVDPQDNLWYIDAGNNLVIKFDQQMHIQMVLGRRPEPWTYMTHVIERAIPQPQNFYQPTDVTWGPDGSIYRRRRLRQFAGGQVQQGGQSAQAMGRARHRAPASSTRRTASPSTGTTRCTWPTAPMAASKPSTPTATSSRNGASAAPPWSLCITPGPRQVMYVGSVGKVIKVDLDGKVLGQMGKFGRVPGTFDWVHGIACPDEHTVYAAQELSWRLDKINVE